MAIALNTADWKNEGGDNNRFDGLVVDAANNVSAGDLLVIAIEFEALDSSDVINSVPASFIEFNHVVHSNSSTAWSPETYIYYKIAEASDETDSTNSSGLTYTFGKSADRTFSYTSMRITGHDATTPLANSSSNDAEGATALSIPGITATSGNVLMSVIGIGEFNTSSEISSITHPSEMTEQVEILQSHTRGCAMGLATEAAPSGATGSRDWSWDVSTNATGILFEINVDAGATYTLTAEQGSYSLTGQATGLLRTLRLISQQGSYAYTGQTTNLLKTYLLAAEQGSYTIVGADSELLETFILEAESGNYSLTGQETQFFKTLKLIAEQGSYTVSGQTTNLLRNLLLTAEQGSYTLSGQDAIISAVSNYILTAESGSYSLTGNDTAFLRSLILEAEQGSYTLTGQQTELLRKLLLIAASGTYTLTGEDIALTVEDSPEILILMSAIVSSLELDSTITTELDLDSSV